MIKSIHFDRSPELEREIQFHTTQGSPFDKLEDGAAVQRHVEVSSDYMDLAALARQLSPRTVLDIGVGSGLTSAYLALSGHTVTCVEPAPSACERMESDFRRLNLSIDVVQSTAEVLDSLSSKFDLIVFNSSLHHCDDPIRALRVAREKLKPGGSLFLFEPVLRIYRSKAWFYRMLEEHPEKVGHYGGNEHIYRFREYLQFLRQAGFHQFSVTPSKTYRIIPKRAGWDSPGRYVLKRAYYAGVRGTVLPTFPGSLVRPILFQLSLLNPVILAKP